MISDLEILLKDLGLIYYEKSGWDDSVVKSKCPNFLRNMG